MCGGSCADAELAPLLTPQLSWLWAQVASAADRRGEPDLTAGTLKVTAPQPAADRAAATGLLGGHALRPGQSRTVVLKDLHKKLTVRGPHLTPGAVAAHATGRPLAVKAREQTRRDAAVAALRAQLDAAQALLPDHAHDRVLPDVWPVLQQSGWVSRLLKDADPAGLLREACWVLAALPVPGRRLDRRVLVAGRPHALDDGTALSGLVFALTGVAGRRPRHAWDALGVDIDNLTGGLLALGIAPEGWHLPPGAVVTLPPRELSDVRWPVPATQGGWVFVTENPSVVAAAADLVRENTATSDGLAVASASSTAGGQTTRLLCTVGTPSAVETAAVGRLAAAGWNVAVRADFDPAGLAHVRALLAAAPTALPWRMDVAAYEQSVAATPRASFKAAPALSLDPSATPWAPALAAAMAAHGVPAFEEDLLPRLLDDLQAGRPAH